LSKSPELLRARNRPDRPDEHSLDGQRPELLGGRATAPTITVRVADGRNTELGCSQDTAVAL
jgi:hypothetical protein